MLRTTVFEAGPVFLFWFLRFLISFYSAKKPTTFLARSFSVRTSDDGTAVVVNLSGRPEPADGSIGKPRQCARRNIGRALSGERAKRCLLVVFCYISFLKNHDPSNSSPRRLGVPEKALGGMTPDRTSGLKIWDGFADV